MPDLRAAAALVAVAALLVTAAPAIAGPAEQPPFGGEPAPEAVSPPANASVREVPPGFRLSPAEAIGIALHAAGEVEVAKPSDPEGLVSATAFEDRTWEVLVEQEGEPELLVIVDDASGEVLDEFSDHQVETPLARGYEDAVAGDVNEAWFWLPLCLLFLAPFIDFRRPLRLLHLDLLVLLAFSASLFFFNKGEIEASVTLVYPVLAYVFVRMLIAGLRPRDRDERLVPHLSSRWLLAGIAALAAAQVVVAIVEAKVIDVGIASVIGADRLLDGPDIYGEGFSEGIPVRGDVYGPVNYLAYAPFELAFPWSGEWDGVPAARAAALGFSLLTALALFALGRRLRDAAEGRTLGLGLAFAWLAYPFGFYALGSSFNDALVALLLVCTLLAFDSPPARGAVAALAGLTKFGPLALAPLLAAGTGERRWRSAGLFALGFAAVALLATLPLLPDGGLREAYDRSLGYQASRGSPFSIWGLAPSLEPLQTASKLFAVGLGLALFFVPRRRDTIQVAALAAAAIVAVQVAAAHWLYPYTLWFAPLVLVALFAAQRGETPVRESAARVSTSG